MNEIICLDSNMKPIESFVQWDVNQTIYIEGFNFSTTPLVHFSNAKIDYALSVGTTEQAENVIAAKIPNILLQDNSPLLVYIYEYDTNKDTGRTTHFCKIHIVPKSKPNDYEYEEVISGINVNALDTRVRWLMQKYEELESKIEELTPKP